MSTCDLKLSNNTVLFPIQAAQNYKESEFEVAEI